jgi:hypothetical protein
MDRAPSVAHERLKWLEKTVYEEVRDEAGATAPAPAVAGVVRAVLQRRADSLRSVYPVTIHYDILDTLTVSDSPGSQQMGMQLFKLGSKRLAVPVADGIWGAGR